MKKYLFGAVALVAGALVACTEQAVKVEGLVIEKQGVFSSGGRVTEPIAGEYDPTQNWLDQERKGTTTHVDHANTLYQIPAGGSGTPVVFLHGYGQTRTGWQSTPAGRRRFGLFRPQRTASTLSNTSSVRWVCLQSSLKWASPLTMPPVVPLPTLPSSHQAAASS